MEAFSWKPVHGRPCHGSLRVESSEHVGLSWKPFLGSLFIEALVTEPFLWNHLNSIILMDSFSYDFSPPKQRYSVRDHVCSWQRQCKHYHRMLSRSDAGRKLVPHAASVQIDDFAWSQLELLEATLDSHTYLYLLVSATMMQRGPRRTSLPLSTALSACPAFSLSLSLSIHSLSVCSHLATPLPNQAKGGAFFLLVILSPVFQV